MTFALVVLLTMATGDVNAYVLDSGLTYQDCRASLAHGVSAVVLEDGRTITIDDATPVVCELEAV